MIYDYNNYNNFNWFQRNAKDSYKYTEKLSKLGAKIQSLSDKINSLKDIKIEITEKSLENNEKSFTLKIVGNLNIGNKNFIKDIADQFASILDNYKSKKMEELSKELDSTIEEMKNLFPQGINIYRNGCNEINCDMNGKTWIETGDATKLYFSEQNGLLYENKNDVIKTVINWKNDINSSLE